jgi:hypothetical protein
VEKAWSKYEMPKTHARGSIRAHENPRILHSEGIIGKERTIMAAIIKVDINKDSQKRLRILGTSTQKFDFSTSFLVAPHVMLYENRCARMAWEMWMLNPPKKKKLGDHIRTDVEE